MHHFFIRRIGLVGADNINCRFFWERERIPLSGGFYFGDMNIASTSGASKNKNGITWWLGRETKGVFVK